MSEVLGIDVSHYQKSIDWNKVSRSEKKFAVLKAMYEAQSHRIDECFEANYRGAGQNGISRGVYIFIASSSIKDPETDAKSLLRILQDRPLEYGIWLDYESDVLRKIGKQNITQLTDVYEKAFRSAGYYVGIYCNKDWYDNVISDSLKSRFDFWIARYPRNDVGAYNERSSLKPSYKTAVAWQYSSKGSVPGISTPVDLDVDFDGVVSLIAQTPYKKTNEEIVQEVIEGKWGTKNTNPSREKLLTMAGYDYQTIRRMVNEYYAKRG